MKRKEELEEDYESLPWYAKLLKRYLLLKAIIAIGGFLLPYMSVFIVAEHELAVRARLGQFQDAPLEPGFNYLIPFIDKIIRIDASMKRRLLLRDLDRTDSGKFLMNAEAYTHSKYDPPGIEAVTLDRWNVGVIADLHYYLLRPCSIERNIVSIPDKERDVQLLGQSRSAYARAQNSTAQSYQLKQNSCGEKENVEGQNRFRRFMGMFALSGRSSENVQKNVDEWIEAQVTGAIRRLVRRYPIETLEYDRESFTHNLLYLLGQEERVKCAKVIDSSSNAQNSRKSSSEDEPQNDCSLVRYTGELGEAVHESIKVPKPNFRTNLRRLGIGIYSLEVSFYFLEAYEEERADSCLAAARLSAKKLHLELAKSIQEQQDAELEWELKALKTRTEAVNTLSGVRKAFFDKWDGKLPNLVVLPDFQHVGELIPGFLPHNTGIMLKRQNTPQQSSPKPTKEIRNNATAEDGESQND